VSLRHFHLVVSSSHPYAEWSIGVANAFEIFSIQCNVFHSFQCALLELFSIVLAYIQGSVAVD
jgi:hypothetical protein